MIRFALTLFLAQTATLPPCTPGNLGQCVPSLDHGQVCGNTPMGLGWMGVAGCEDERTKAWFLSREDAGMYVVAAPAPVPVDAGYDAPWKETGPDGGTLVCMTEATAVLVARGGVVFIVEGDENKATVVRGDPALKTVLFTLAGLLVGGAAAAAAICGTGHCR